MPAAQVNNLALELFARGTGVSADHLLCLAIVRFLALAGWSLINSISPDEDELAQTMIYAAQREGVRPREFVRAAIMDLMLSDDAEALLIRYPAPSHSIH